jgi:predicted O-methyltransferase YrrM
LTLRRKLGGLSWRVGHRLTQPGIDPVREKVSDALALSELASLPGGYVPWTAASMRPRGVATVLNSIVIRDRERIVECGGGASTIFIARLLGHRRGHLWTVEHDPGWAAQLERAVAVEGLADRVTIVVAPLERGWYSQSVLESALPREGIDLLLVDGPPAIEAPLARYPAGPFFRGRLADDATIVLDDIVRPGEQQIAASWERELGVEFERRPLEGRIAIAHTRPGFGA